MRKIRILYVGGGSENDNADKLIKAELDKRGISYSFDAPEFALGDPGKMANLSLFADSSQYEYIIASSLGAFYSLPVSGSFRILINPVLPSNLSADQGFNADFLDKLRICQDYYLNVYHNNENSFDTYLIFGALDDIARNEEFFKKYYNDENHILHIDMGHNLNEAGAEKVCGIIEMLEKEQPVYEWKLIDRLAAELDEFDVKNRDQILKQISEETVFGMKIDEFVDKNPDRTIAEVFGAEPFWYAVYPVRSLQLSRHAFAVIHRIMNPPVCYPSGCHGTMDEFLELTVGQVWRAGIYFSEIMTKTEAWLKKAGGAYNNFDPASSFRRKY